MNIYKIIEHLENFKKLRSNIPDEELKNLPEKITKECEELIEALAQSNTNAPTSLGAIKKFMDMHIQMLTRAAAIHGLANDRTGEFDEDIKDMVNELGKIYMVYRFRELGELHATDNKNQA